MRIDEKRAGSSEAKQGEKLDIAYIYALYCAVHVGNIINQCSKALCIVRQHVEHRTLIMHENFVENLVLAELGLEVIFVRAAPY